MRRSSVGLPRNQGKSHGGGSISIRFQRIALDSSQESRCKKGSSKRKKVGIVQISWKTKSNLWEKGREHHPFLYFSFAIVK